MAERYDSEPPWAERAPVRPVRPRAPVLPAVLASVLTSALVTVGLHFVLVPGGVGWRKLEHEGTVTVHGNNAPLKVEYPSSFARPPSLDIEALGNDVWFYRIAEQTNTHFVIVNTTVNARTQTPVALRIKWKASGARW
jgi:hypothetical protein